MLIGELSKKSGLSRDTIRFYEKIGLITVGRRARRENNNKEYSDDVLARLVMANQLKEFGFTLGEIREMLGLMDAGLSPCQDMPELLAGRIRELEEKIARLELFRDRLTHAWAACNGSCRDLFSEAGCLSNCADRSGDTERYFPT